MRLSAADVSQLVIARKLKGWPGSEEDAMKRTRSVGSRVHETTKQACIVRYGSHERREEEICHMAGVGVEEMRG